MPRSEEARKWMPIQLHYLKEKHLPRRVPMAKIAHCEARAQSNHGGQTLERLEERGGICPLELWMIYHDRKLFSEPTPLQEECHALLLELAADDA